MRPFSFRSRRAAIAALLTLAAHAAACTDETVPEPKAAGGTGGAGGELDLDAYLSAPKSCAYKCPVDDCPEATSPYECPAMHGWAEIPHAEACPAWDGTYPASAAGQCEATAPAGDALKRPGLDPDSPGTRILPDGRATRPAGAEWVFDEAELTGTITTFVTAVPGTPLIVTVDTGTDDHVVRVVDTSKIGGGGSPVTSFAQPPHPKYLQGSAAFVAPGRLYVATQYGVVQAFSLDTATGVIALDDAASLTLPPSVDANGDPDEWYVASVAASPDGAHLVVAGVNETEVLVYDIDPASPTHDQLLGQVDIGEKQTFAVAFDPQDPTGSRAYLTVWGKRKVLEIDLTDPTAPSVSRSFATDQNPQGMAFLDARWLAVANDLGETISLVDRVSGGVTAVPVDFEPGLHGLDVSTVAFDPSSQRLFATLAGVNAVAAYDVDLAQDPPAVTPAGRLPTAWWPGGLVVHPDGSLTVTSLRGHGIGPYLEPNGIGDGNGKAQMRGSVQQIPAPTPADLAAGDAQVMATVAVGDRAGYPTVSCPGGAADFPVPATNTEGPSPKIEHVFFIVRENKSFDALFGDLPGVEGDAALAMKASSEDMDRVWTNLRELSRTFTLSDNFYNLAVQSTQGHTWTTYGRANDFDERTWTDDARPVPLSGVGTVGRPAEGSLFEWLQKNDVRYDLLGEIVGNPDALPPDYNPIDIRYPGGPAQNITYNDLEKACYTAARTRVACNIATFVYMTLPNDHTIGVSPDNPTPEVMCAVNDEATGLIVDAISHSPLWASSLIVITEDDPQQGGDHVDYHRTPLVLVSPWVKRGYVSRTHIDVPSLHKLFAHVLGKPYPNLIVKNAGLPLDMFTSTPDFTPYTFTHRAWPLQCGAAATAAEHELTSSWDFSEVDEQPGLGEQVMRWMRGRQLTELSPAMRATIEARKERRARGLPPIEDDD